MGAIYILWLRELKRYVRSRVQIVVSLGQPCLYLLALGFGFGPVFQQAGHGSYLQFMAPGVVGMTVRASDLYLLSHHGASRYQMLHVSLENPGLARADVVVPVSENVLQN